jgi:apolipoprotein D and lipocalin family protein
MFGTRLALGATALQPVAGLDLKRYQGVWYEIAKYPNRFQKVCEGGTTATYTIQESGQVEVLNRCRKADGSYTEARGAARRSEQEASRLQVRFAPAWLAWLPAVWAPYWVFDLDRDYTLAAVGEPERQYLWILSRAPTVDPARYEALLSRIRAAGYEPGRLESTRQP